MVEKALLKFTLTVKPFITLIFLFGLAILIKQKSLAKIVAIRESSEQEGSGHRRILLSDSKEQGFEYIGEC